MNLTNINFSSIWAMLVGTALAITYMFTHFASGEEVDDLKELMIKQNIAQDVRAAYGQYYDRLDDFDEAEAEGNDDLAKEYARQMEGLRALICENDKEWERCDD